MRSLLLGVAIVTGWLAWWAPTIALWLARLVGLHACHRGELLLADLLYALRRDRAARRVLAASIRRNRRHLRAARWRAQGRKP